MWEVTKFIDYRGKIPKKTNNGIPLITAKNIKNGYISNEPREYINEATYVSWMKRGIPQIRRCAFYYRSTLRKCSSNKYRRENCISSKNYNSTNK